MRKLSEETLKSAQHMEEKAHDSAENIKKITLELANNVTGTRLSDLALTNIELIDRNLYERSCDVRWWATDSSVWNALKSDATQQDKDFACKRLGVILNAYTVYFDIVVCDLQGTVIANGRKEQYASIGMNVRSSDWFSVAITQNSGDEYAFASVHKSSLVNNERALIYACTVRQNGDVNGRVLGVLGVVFRYDALAQTIMHNTPLLASEKDKTRVCIIDESGTVLADSEDKVLVETLDIENKRLLLAEKKNHVVTKVNGKTVLVGHAQSPGYETYKTGWHSMLIQDV
ncbi:MAG: cache domain-containing protein [Candidatus Woesearchaeota archaeon]